MRSRLLLVMVLGALWLTGLGARLVWLQVIAHDDYDRRAANQQRRVLDLEPPRGTIYDARGRVLAVSLEVESVYAEPEQVADPTATAAALVAVLGGDEQRLAERLAMDRGFVWVARKLDRPQAAAVRALDLAGIHFLRESKRYYPMRELAAPVLGFVGTDHVGLAGLEARYDDLVAGRPGRRTVLRDAHRQTLLSPRLEVVEAEPGQDLYLTIDAAVQHIVEKELRRGVEESNARQGRAVVLDPRTGAVVALASWPSFDPNRFREVPPERWRQRALTDAYEPGSTFKIFTAAAVLSHGLMTVDDTLDCEMGGITLAGVRIRDHHPYGVLSLAQVMAKSSNVGVIKMGLLLGEQRLWEAIDRFGFGQRTGIDLLGESRGIVRPVTGWSALSKAYISFGQEVSVTPLQLARAVGAVANGGRLLRPHVVAASADENGRRPLARNLDQGSAVRPDVAADLRQMLAGVVTAGTGRRAAVPGYTVGGKTGTAQKIVDGRYSRSLYIASFVGLAPVENPRLVAVVTLDEPRPRYHGGEVAAPVFARLAEQILLYWGVPPSPRPQPPLSPVVPEDLLEAPEMPQVMLAAGRPRSLPPTLAVAEPSIAHAATPPRVLPVDGGLGRAQ